MAQLMSAAQHLTLLVAKALTDAVWVFRTARAVAAEAVVGGRTASGVRVNIRLDIKDGRTLFRETWIEVKPRDEPASPRERVELAPEDMRANQA